MCVYLFYFICLEVVDENDDQSNISSCNDQSMNNFMNQTDSSTSDNQSSTHTNNNTDSS